MQGNRENLIGILGGTFDPVHRGHINLAKQALSKLQFQEVRLLPCFMPVHREAVASASDRLAMLQLAILNEKNLLIDDREIKRQGPSYMIDTLISLRNEFPKQPLCLLMATDALVKFNHWHHWQEIFNYAHLVIVQRPECAAVITNDEFAKFIDARKTEDSRQLHNHLQGSIFFSDIVGLPISSTSIRQRIAAGEEMQNGLPEKVWEYIKQKKLYGMM